MTKANHNCHMLRSVFALLLAIMMTVMTGCSASASALDVKSLSSSSAALNYTYQYDKSTKSMVVTQNGTLNSYTYKNPDYVVYGNWYIPFMELSNAHLAPAYAALLGDKYCDYGQVYMIGLSPDVRNGNLKALHFNSPAETTDYTFTASKNKIEITCGGSNYVITFDDQGKVLSMLNTFSGGIRISYNGDKVQSVKYDWNADAKINAQGQITSVTSGYSRGSTTTVYHYDSKGLIKDHTATTEIGENSFIENSTQQVTYRIDSKGIIRTETISGKAKGSESQKPFDYTYNTVINIK